MSDRDVDAEFADIIARWDEVESLPDTPGTAGAAGPDAGVAGPDAGSAGTGDGATSGDRATSGEGVFSGEGAVSDQSGQGSPGTEGGNGSPTVEGVKPGSGVNPALRPSVNPPPNRPFVVWRGAEQPDPSQEDSTADPVELLDLDDEDDHFQPGPTAPLPPQEDLQFWGIIVGLVAGPLLRLWLVLFPSSARSDWWTLGALGLIVMGFVLLVLRQPRTRSEDDPDNGARV